VNCAVPGLIRTNFSKSLWENEKNAKIAMGINRLGEPRDVANLVKFLLSIEADYITGESVGVAGRIISRL
jgi:dehydrogenase/reductase SDR family protein 4